MLVVIIYVLKANTVSHLLILISFLEGIFTKMYEISINKEFYSLSKDFEYEKYNFAYEFTQNFMRSLVVLLILFVNDVKLMIYITLIFVISGIFVNSSVQKLKE